jgi:hypothetical protein
MTSQATKNTLVTDIENAAPGVFNGQQKELLFALWCRTFWQRVGVK